MPFDAGSGRYLTSMYSTGGFRAVYHISSEEMKAEAASLNRVLSVGILALTLFIISLGFVLSLHIQRRFSRVLGKIEAVSQGTLAVEPAGEATDEIGLFDKSFTEMVDRTRQLIEKNYISEVKKKDAQLMALQAQIQPHFLFNSLEIINSLVEIGRYDTACEVNARLSSLLRYSINYNSSGVVTLQDEIVYMKDYLYIQNLRFQDRYCLHEDIQTECLKQPMLKMVLQPMVENCIKHGFANAASGNIWIGAHMQNNMIMLDIRDDGKGMERDVYLELTNRLDRNPIGDFQDKSESIGILNIHNRLRLKYGDSYQIRIHSAPAQGMRIEIILPVMEDTAFFQECDLQ